MIHLIGNAHLDPVWLWRFQEGYSEVLATFRSALDRMNEFPDYIFTCAGAQYYKWVEDTDPEMFAEIRQRIKEGRWVVVGGWWIQPDCNTPGGESYARQALYSQRYYREKFDIHAKVGYNVDSFGHSASLPQLLKEGGLNAYVYMRPNASDEMRYPFEGNTFLWEGIDGTTLPAYRIPVAYGTYQPQTAVERKELLEKSGRDEMLFYGVGNHGGGPTIETLCRLEEMKKDDPALIYSSPDAYFAAIDTAALPHYKGELQHHASGCYTSVMDIKQLNRIAEQRLLAAEKYCVLAGRLGFETDTAQLSDAWQTLLFNQFHDIMGGCTIREACDDAVTAFRYALHIAAIVTNNALQKLAWRIDTSRGSDVVRNKTEFKLWNRKALGTPFTVFNPHSWDADLPLRTGDICVSSVQDENGNTLPSQRVRSSVTNGRDDKYETLFFAKVPAMGWKTFYLMEKDADCEPENGDIVCSDTHLENDFISADFDKATGAITSIVDKRTGKEQLSAPAEALIIDETDCDTWAHAVFAFRNVVGKADNAEVKLMESGRLCARIRIRSRCHASLIERYVTIYRDRPELHLSWRIVWNEEHKQLKLSFPTVYKGVGEKASVPYGFISRIQDGNEQPMQNWVSVGDFGIVTDSRTAYDALGGEVRITALRSPIFADHFGERDDFCRFSEQGEHCFEMILTFGETPAALTKKAIELACPCERILGTYHRGNLPETFCGIKLDSETAYVSAVKKAEDGNGIILRLAEADGKDTELKLELPLTGKQLNTVLHKHEIQTCRLTDTFTRVDFTEE